MINTTCYLAIFPENCMKMKKIVRAGWRGAAEILLCESATVQKHFTTSR